MTNPPPLTDNLIENIAPNVHWDEYGDPVFSYADMRAVADWQLKQVIKWLNETIFEQTMCVGIESLPEELEKAMRPQQQQQQEDNND